MDEGLRSYGEELVAVLSAARDALQELPSRVCRLTAPDLDAVLPVVDVLAAVAAAGRFTIAADAESRGEVAGSQAGSLAQWLAERCPTLEPREAGLVAKAVRELAPAQLAPARDAVASGRMSVAAGCAVASELRQLTPLLEPGAEEAVLAGLVTIGQSEGCAGVRGLRTAMLARYGHGDRLDDDDNRRAGLTTLSCGRDIGGGITEYRMRLTPESRAVVEAAVNTLSAPHVVDGARDPRTVEQRRGDALVDVCRKAVSLAPALTATDPAAAAAAATSSGVKATVIVTIGLDDLRDRTRPGVLLGGLTTGGILGPETLRKISCDAALIPAVLDLTGQPLLLGRTTRLFTPAQTKALWLRDRHCTFPGCRAPATWCDAHHIRHWADGGPTDLTNATLLCGRHHTIVHRDRLHAMVTPTGVVEWDRRPGSYDRALARSSLPDDSAA